MKTCKIENLFNLKETIAAGLFAIGPLLAILLMVPILVYSLVIIDVNTDSYVSRLTEKYVSVAEQGQGQEKA